MCPTGAEVTSTGCAGASCVATRCASGYVLCASGCCPAPGWTFDTIYSASYGTPSIVLDAADTPHVAHSAESPRGIHYSQLVGGVWVRETVDSATNALRPDITLDLSGSPVIAYYVSSLSSDTAYVSRRTGSGWSPSVIGTSRGDPSFAIHSDGSQFAATLERVSGGTSTIRFHWRRSSTAGWTSYLVSNTTTWMPPRLAVDAAGIAWVAHIDGSGQFVASERTSTFGFTSRLLTYSEPWAFDIAIDDASTEHVVFYDSSNHTIRHARRSGSNWSFQTVDSSGGTPPGSSHFSGVSLAAHGSELHVAYLDFSRGQALRYARRIGGVWNVETVTSAADVLGRTAIAVDTAGNPHIVFPALGGTWGRLRYAVYR